MCNLCPISSQTSSRINSSRSNLGGKSSSSLDARTLRELGLGTNNATNTGANNTDKEQTLAKKGSFFSRKKAKKDEENSAKVVNGGDEGDLSLKLDLENLDENEENHNTTGRSSQDGSE